MVGPVLRQEMLLGGRRNRLHVLRWLYAALLIFQIVVLFFGFLAEESALAQANLASTGEYATNHASAPEVVGARFASLFVWQQTLFLFLAIPIFTAGAIVDEKRQGTLQYLLLTEMESRHILLGKLVGRVAQVLLWLLAGFPLFALCAGFGGIEPVTLVFLGLGMLLPVYALAAASLLASVMCRQTRDAVLAVYVLLVAGGLLVNLYPGALAYFDPRWVVEPAWGSGNAIDLAEASRRLVVSSLLWGAIGTLSIVVAAARLPIVYVREIENVKRERLRWYSLEREPVTSEPVLWREQHIEGLAPNPTLRRVPQWLGIVLVALASTVSSLAILYHSMSRTATTVDVVQALLQLNVRKVTTLILAASEGFLVQGVVVMLLASLVVGVRCAGAVAQERERHTWEALLLTPLSARQIVRGKLWGITAASIWYLLAYAAPAVSLSVLGGPLALTNTLLSLGVTVLATYFIGAAGLWCSVRASTSWRSLLQTMAVGYLGGLAIYAVCSPVLIIVAFILLLFLLFVDLGLGTNLAGLGFRNTTYFLRVFFLSSAIGLVAIFWLMARWFLNRAQRWIADRERTRHWQDEPIYRRSRSTPRR